MTYKEALDYIHSICWRGSRPGLSRISELCGLLGNPQKGMKFIHIAGTNGKGSVSAMLSSILTEAGYKVGVFTSPYIYSFNERMCAGGNPISESELAEIIERIKSLAEKMADAPTEFELINAAAFELFKMKGCDIVVLECGMGGRLDSTNIIEAPLVSVITGVALDHTAYLGDTTEKIAVEKAGIIKKGCPTVVGEVDGKAEKVIREKAEECASRCYFTDTSKIENVRLSLDGTAFTVNGEEYKLSLCGSYQSKNALVAIKTAEILGIGKHEVHNGLAKTKWSARFEVLHKNPTVIFDGGHNPQGVAAAVETVSQIIDGKVNILTGVMADKSYNEMISLVKPVCEKAYCITPDNPRALPAADYKKAFEVTEVPAEAYGSIEEAVAAAYEDSKRSGKALLALGSLYMYREVHDALEKIGII